jgi:tRNA threonylcarbamoyladenosine biosynthesis protein TsaB
VLVLAIDASTYSGSVALIRDHSVSGEAVVAMRGEHEERLMPAVAGLLSQNSVAVDRLDAVACGAGPGSFTSLRIAASIAKGLSAAREIPLLVAPSTLLVVAATTSLAPGSYVVALDAMRGDFFWQDIRTESNGSIVPGTASRTTRSELEERAQASSARIIGPAESPPLSPHARGFARLIERGLATPVELTTWEPNYGRKAEAQVRWEATHGRELGTA